ncbi:MAG: hypothetical protein ACTTJM_09080 [Bergeyella cardium]
MNIIEILNQDLEKVLEVKGEGIYIEIKDGIQCICKDTSWGHFDSDMIIYTVPRNFFLIQKQENENKN